jgi:hypothetical protein
MRGLFGAEKRGLFGRKFHYVVYTRTYLSAAGYNEQNMSAAEHD